MRGRGDSVTRLGSALAPVRVTGLSPVAGSPPSESCGTPPGFSGTTSTTTCDKARTKRRCRDLLARASRLREDGLTAGASPLPGQLTRLCTALVRQRPPRGLPCGWHSVLCRGPRYGPRLHLDLDTALPPAEGTAVRLNTLASQPGSWDLHLQASPGWLSDNTDGPPRGEPMTVFAEDDLGGLYLSNFGGSLSCPGYQEVKLEPRPRLAPGARLLTLTFAGRAQQVTAEIPLAP